MCGKTINESLVYREWLAWAEDDIKYAKKALRDEECICPALFSVQQFYPG
jgi:hypothetical protein